MATDLLAQFPTPVRSGGGRGRAVRPRLDPLTQCMTGIKSIVGRYPQKMRAELHRGMGMTGGNAWQILDAFPWLAVRMFLVDDEKAKSAREMATNSASLREIAAAVEVPMCASSNFIQSLQRVSCRCMTYCLCTRRWSAISAQTNPDGNNRGCRPLQRPVTAVRTNSQSG